MTDQTLTGEWECTDLSKVEHVSQFAKVVLKFRSDGKVVSYMVDQKGDEIQREVEPYRARGNSLRFGESDDRYRFEIRGNILTLTIVKSQAGDDVGATMEYHLKRE